MLKLNGNNLPKPHSFPNSHRLDRHRCNRHYHDYLHLLHLLHRYLWSHSFLTPHLSLSLSQGTLLVFWGVGEAKYRLVSQVLEIQIIFHSMIIGVTLGMSRKFSVPHYNGLRVWCYKVKMLVKFYCSHKTTHNKCLFISSIIIKFHN